MKRTESSPLVIESQVLNPNLTGIIYSLIVFGGGHVSVLTSLLGKSYFVTLNFELKLYLFVMTKAVSSRDICFIKAVLFLYEHGYF